MNFDFKNKLYIGCIPVWAHPTHPKDQSSCVIRDCPTCGKEMWVSEKKRAHLATRMNVEIHCLKCLAEGGIAQGVELEITDIARMN
jgi:hypothetical protein